ncbi:putative Rho guanyl-nucleotide exchange factor [Rhodotorula toruloides]|nr:putative Rho guanyl-nucleotide exchange factor [Rhodotorula toruloides]
MPVVFPDELEGGLIGRNTAARNLVSHAMRQAGIDQNSRLLSRTGSGSIQQQRLYMDQYAPDEDGYMHHRTLDAKTGHTHNDVKSLFYNPDAPADKRLARISTNQDHHKGTLIFKDKKLGRLPTPATSDTDDEDEPLRQKLPLGSFGLSGPSSTSAGLPVFAAPAPVDLHPEGTPKTLDDLLDILRQHKPGKKIIEIAGDIDIKETFVTTAIIHVHGIGPARRPVLAVLCRRLPNNHIILAHPDWQLGDSSPTDKVLILRITKQIHVHIQFKLEIPV